MKTPCQSDPEMWVSDQRDARKAAAAKCAECPVESFIACIAYAKATKPKLGVYAGRDYHPNNPNRTGPETKKCQQCGVTFNRHNTEARDDFAARKFCSRGCSAASRRRAA